MPFRIPLFLAAALSVSAAAGLATAQEPPRGPWGLQVPLGFAYMSGAGLQDRGEVSITRWFVQPGVRYTGTDWGSVGFSVGYGEASYDFSDGAALGGGDPWDRIRDLRFSLPVTIEPNDRMDILVIPSLRYNAETGADLSDGQTFGVLAGVAWQINDNLWIGPGVGWFSALEDSDSVFPVLLIEWEFADNWSLSTGEGFGATQGPGLTLNWQATDAWRIGLTARYEKVRFRLDDSGPAPGGVGEDESIPIVLGASWEPNPGMRFSAFAGVQTGGKVRIYDRGGTEIERSDYDTAPLFGMTARFRF